MNGTKRSGLTRTEREYEDLVRTVDCPVCSSTPNACCTEPSERMPNGRFPLRISHTGRWRKYRGEADG